MKLCLFFCVFVLIAVVMNPVAATAPGFITAMSAPAMQKIVNNVLPGVISKLKTASFPNIKGSKSIFTYEVKDIHMTELTVGAFNIAANTDGMRLDVKDLDVIMDMSWKYKSKIGIPFGSGTATATLSDGNIGGTFLLGTTETADGLKPTLTAKDVSCSINKIKVKTHKSLFSWLYNIIIGAFTGSIKSTLESSVRDGIKTGISAASDSILSTLPMKAPIGDWGVIDYALTAGASHHNNAIVVPFNGEIMDADKQQSDATMPRHNIALDPDSHLFQILVDTFVFNSGLHTAYKKGVFHQVVDSESGSKSPIPLHTSAYKDLLPKLYEDYPDAEMKADVVFADQPAVAAAAKSFAMSVPVSYKFSVMHDGDWKHVFTIRNDANGAVDVSIDVLGAGQGIYAQIKSLSTKYSLQDSIVGMIDLTALNTLLDFILKGFVIPVVNAELLSGIPLPVAKGMQIENTQFQFVSNAIRISTDLTYNP